MSFIFENDSLANTENGIKQLAQQEVLPRFRHVDASTKADGSVLTEADTEMQKATEAS